MSASQSRSRSREVRYIVTLRIVFSDTAHGSTLRKSSGTKVKGAQTQLDFLLHHHHHHHHSSDGNVVFTLQGGEV